MKLVTTVAFRTSIPRAITVNQLCFLFMSDVTPPSTQNCPASFSDQSNNLQKQVTWTPPVFTDNVGVTSVLSNRQPGFTMDTYTSITIRYTATDAAGNIAYCKFNITLEGSWNKPLLPANGILYGIFALVYYPFSFKGCILYSFLLACLLGWLSCLIDEFACSVRSFVRSRTFERFSSSVGLGCSVRQLKRAKDE